MSIEYIDNNIVHENEKVNNCIRLTARTTTQIQDFNLITTRKEKELTMNTKKFNKLPTVVLDLNNELSWEKI